MSTKHTPEPWRVEYMLSGTKIFGPKPGNLILTMSKINLPEQSVPDAQRIVECVNAMAGIEDPKKLRETWEICKELELDRYPKLKARYDEIIDLLKLCKARFEVKSDILQSPTIIARIDEVLKKHEPCQEQ